MPPKGRRRLNDGYQVGQYVEVRIQFIDFATGQVLRWFWFWKGSVRRT